MRYIELIQTILCSVHSHKMDNLLIEILQPCETLAIYDFQRGYSAVTYCVYTFAFFLKIVLMYVNLIKSLNKFGEFMSWERRENNYGISAGELSGPKVGVSWSRWAKDCSRHVAWSFHLNNIGRRSERITRKSSVLGTERRRSNCMHT